MEPKLLNDLVFRAVFGQEKSKHVLICLLNALLQYPKENRIADITLLNPYQTANSVWDKYSILDLKAQDLSGTFYNIEVQLRAEKSFIPRVVYYTAKMFSDQLHGGEGYHTLRKTI